MRFYYGLACAVMAVHALFILWVIFGALATGRRPLLRFLHIASLLWGVSDRGRASALSSHLGGKLA